MFNCVDLTLNTVKIRRRESDPSRTTCILLTTNSRHASQYVISLSVLYRLSKYQMFEPLVRYPTDSIAANNNDLVLITAQRWCFIERDYVLEDLFLSWDRALFRAARSTNHCLNHLFPV